MATTSSRLTAAVLSAFSEAGIGWAILHGEEDVARGEVGSDVDLVTRLPMAVALRGPLAELLAGRDIYPVIYWPYDVAGTATVFFASGDATEGVQVDALHDPDARGKFGVRTDVLLDHSEPGVAWPRVDAPFSLLYQVRKRHWKSQHERIPELRERLEDYEPDATRRAASVMFDPDTRDLVLQLVEGADPARFATETPAYWLRNLGRKAARLAAPIGAWVEFDGPEAATAADLTIERLGRLINVARRADRPTGPGAALWWARVVVPVRWRPGLVAGVGAGGHPMPDLIIHSDHADTAVRALVHGLAERATRS